MMECVVCEQPFNSNELRLTYNLASDTTSYRCKPCFQGETSSKPDKPKKKKKAKKDEPKDSGITLTKEDLVTE